MMTPAMSIGEEARLYGVVTTALNRQVKRNEERFPKDFMLRLSAEEWDNLKCPIGISSWAGHYSVRQKHLDRFIHRPPAWA